MAITFELPSTLTAEVSNTYGVDIEKTVDLYFGNIRVKSWPITEEQADKFHADPDELDQFIADKLAPLFREEL